MVNENDLSDLIKFVAHIALFAVIFAFAVFMFFLAIAPGAIKILKAEIINPAKEQLSAPVGGGSVKIVPTSGGMFRSE